MKASIKSAAAVAAKAAENGDAPRPLHIAISLALGVLVAIAAGFLHRSDRPDPLIAVTYSPQAALMRAGIALFGTAFLTLATLMSDEQGVSFLIVLLSVAAGSLYGALAYFDVSTLQASIWKGATATASAMAMGQAFLALYGQS
ncbi:hypothetical protein [Streptomyces sp. NPDC048737]|uniref:hypothetical protein n=1 Tax=unclassified Streptomyces TaxID=2593676 RepID=UPI0034166356